MRPNRNKKRQKIDQEHSQQLIVPLPVYSAQLLQYIVSDPLLRQIPNYISFRHSSFIPGLASAPVQQFALFCDHNDDEDDVRPACWAIPLRLIVSVVPTAAALGEHDWPRLYGYSHSSCLSPQTSLQRRAPCRPI